MQTDVYRGDHFVVTPDHIRLFGEHGRRDEYKLWSFSSFTLMPNGLAALPVARRCLQDVPASRRHRIAQLLVSARFAVKLYAEEAIPLHGFEAVTETGGGINVPADIDGPMLLRIMPQPRLAVIATDEHGTRL